MWNRGLQNYTEKVPCTVLLNAPVVLNVPLLLNLILLCLIFFQFLILFIYIIYIEYWQVPLLNAGGPLQIYLFSLALYI